MKVVLFLLVFCVSLIADAQHFGREQTYLFRAQGSESDTYGEYTQTLTFDSTIDGTEYYSYNRINSFFLGLNTY